MDFFVTCAFVISIVLNPNFNTKSLKLCGDLKKSIPTTSKPIVSSNINEVIRNNFRPFFTKKILHTKKA